MSDFIVSNHPTQSKSTNTSMGEFLALCHTPPKLRTLPSDPFKYMMLVLRACLRFNMNILTTLTTNVILGQVQTISYILKPTMFSYEITFI